MAGSAIERPDSVIHPAKSINETRRLLQALAVFSTATTSAAGLDELGPALRPILEGALGAERYGFCLSEASGQHYCFTSDGLESPICGENALLAATLRPEGSTAEVIVLPNDHRWGCAPGQSPIFAPIVVNGATIGHLWACAADDVVADPSTADLLRTLTAQLALVLIRPARLVPRLGPVLAALRTLCTRTLDIEQVMWGITEILTKRFGVPSSIALLDGDHLIQRAWRHPDPVRQEDFGEELRNWILSRDEPLLTDLLQTHGPRYLDAQTLAALPITCDEGSVACPSQGLTAMPLFARDRAVGILLVWERAPQQQPAIPAAVLGQVGRYAGQAVERALEFERESRQRRRAEILVGILRSLLAREPLDHLLAKTVRGVVEATSAAAAAIFLYDADLPVVARTFVHTEDPDLHEVLITAAELPIPDCPAEQQMITTRQPISLGPQDRWSYDTNISPQYPYRLVVPIMNADQVFGAFYLYRSRREPFPHDEVRMAEEIATEAAIAIEQTRLVRSSERQDAILAVVHDLARRLNRAPTLQAIAEIAAEACATALASGMAALHLADASSQRLTLAAAIGLPQAYRQEIEQVAIGSYPSGTAAAERELVVIADTARATDWHGIQQLAQTHPQLRAIWALPLISEQDELLGTVTLFYPEPRAASESDVTLFRVLAHQIAVALERTILADRTRELYRASVASLAAAVDAKDPFTHNHSWRVAAMSRKLAESLGLPPSEVDMIELAGLLHDVGKIGIPDRVLQKPDGLDSDEWAMMRRHPDLGARILADNPALQPVVPIIRHHHERYDGQGYPDGLRGEEIPLGAAIVALADAVETMLSDRPYRRARSLAETIREVKACRGTHFMPCVVDALLDLLQAGEITPILQDTPPVEAFSVPQPVGPESRALGLLQRINGVVTTAGDIGGYLRRINAILEAEFPQSVCNILLREPERGDLYAELDPPDSTVYIQEEGRGIIGWVAQHGVTQNVPDTDADPRYLPPPTGQRMRSELAVPLLVDGYCIGVLNLESPRQAAFSHTDQQVVEMIATYVAQAIQVAMLHQHLRRNTERDPATGLLNERAFQERLEDQIDHAKETGVEFSIALLDADGLRYVNDVAGRAAGDAALRRIAAILASWVRPSDTVARSGDDEFALIIPQVTSWTLQTRLEQIEEVLADAAKTDIVPTVSWGIASFPDDGVSAADLITHAKAALAAAKRQREL